MGPRKRPAVTFLCMLLLALASLAPTGCGISEPAAGDGSGALRVLPTLFAADSPFSMEQTTDIDDDEDYDVVPPPE